MIDVVVIPKPELAGTRLAFVLAEDRVGHYPEFQDFLTRAFDLDRVGLSEAGYVLAQSGSPYSLVFIGRSGERFPAGVEVYAIVPALEPLDEAAVDMDLWSILRWLVAGAGGEWTVEDLKRTGGVYRISAAVSL